MPAAPEQESDSARDPVPAFLRRGPGRAWLGAVAAVFLLVLGSAAAVEPLGALLAVAGLLLLAIPLFAPRIGFYLVLLLYPLGTVYLQYHPPVSSNLIAYPLVRFLLVLLAIGTVARGIRRRAAVPSRPPVSLYVLPLLFLAWAGVCFLWTPDRFHAWRVMFNLTVGFLFFYLVNQFITDAADLRRALRVLAITAILIGPIILLSRYWTYYAETHLGHRWSLVAEVVAFGKIGRSRPAGFEHVNLASGMLVFHVFLALALLPMLRRRWRLLLVPIVVFFLYDEIAMASKAGILSAVIGAQVLVFAYPPARRYSPFLIAGIVALFLGLLVLEVTVFDVDRLAGGSASTAVASESFESRLEDWRAALHAVRSNWLGIGTGGSFRVVYPSPEVHNTFLTILLDFGPIGLVIFVLFLVELFLRWRKAMCRTTVDPPLRWVVVCLGGASAAMGFHAMVNNFHYFLVFWLLAGLLCTTSRIVATEGIHA